METGFELFTLARKLFTVPQPNTNERSSTTLTRSDAADRAAADLPPNSIAVFVVS